VIQSPEVSSPVAVITATLLVLGAATTLVGALGLVRLQSFYQRAHPPTLGTTFGVACVALASMIYFSAAGTRPILHEVLILIFVTATTPITLIILVRATRLRDEPIPTEESSAHE
jgi:multicomponent K+:H+ antiporter subunit G